MKHTSDHTGYQIRDLPVYSAVPQPTTPPRAPILAYNQVKNNLIFNKTHHSTNFVEIHYINLLVTEFFSNFSTPCI